MGRIRHAEPNEISESTSRTMQARFLLRPSEKVNELILGCVAKAQQVYPVDLHGFVFMSNPYRQAHVEHRPSARRLGAVERQRAGQRQHRPHHHAVACDEPAKALVQHERQQEADEHLHGAREGKVPRWCHHRHVDGGDDGVAVRDRGDGPQAKGGGDGAQAMPPQLITTAVKIR